MPRTPFFTLLRLIACGWVAAPLLIAQEPAVTRIADLMATPRVEAANRPAVRVRGLVSLVGEGLANTRGDAPALSSFCVEDESAGIWVAVS